MISPGSFLPLPQSSAHKMDEVRPGQKLSGIQRQKVLEGLRADRMAVKAARTILLAVCRGKLRSYLRVL